MGHECSGMNKENDSVPGLTAAIKNLQTLFVVGGDIHNFTKLSLTNVIVNLKPYYNLFERPPTRNKFNECLAINNTVR